MKQTFTERVYAIVAKIPKGSVATYKDIASLAGNPHASRAVGNAMKHNPDNTKIPCHRVVGSDGSLHGYAFGGITKKQAMLMKEGISFKRNNVDISKYRWRVVK